MNPIIYQYAKIIGTVLSIDCMVAEVGKIDGREMVRVIPSPLKLPYFSRTFTKRKRGEWIERGEATRGGTKLELQED